MINRKITKEQTTFYKTLHRPSNTSHTNNRGWNHEHWTRTKSLKTPKR